MYNTAGEQQAAPDNPLEEQQRQHQLLFQQQHQIFLQQQRQLEQLQQQQLEQQQAHQVPEQIKSKLGTVSSEQTAEENLGHHVAPVTHQYTDEELEQYRLQLEEQGHHYNTDQLRAYLAQQQQYAQQYTEEELEAYRQQIQLAVVSGQYTEEELRQHQEYMKQEEQKQQGQQQSQDYGQLGYAQAPASKHDNHEQPPPQNVSHRQKKLDPGEDAAPPPDPELKKRIDMMANFIVRNGAEFERMVMERNQGNDQFGFLFGKEGSGYFRATLQSLKDGNLAELVRRYQEPNIFPVLDGAPAEELHQLLMGLRHMASQDSIRNGRHFLMTTDQTTDKVVGEIRTFVGDKQVGFDHRLHILYLVHDVLQYEVVQTEGMQITWLTAFRPYLVWLLRCGYCVAPGKAEQEKVLKLLSLWQERKIVSGDEQADMKMLVTADLSKIEGVHPTCAEIIPERAPLHPAVVAAPHRHQLPMCNVPPMGGIASVSAPMGAVMGQAIGAPIGPGGQRPMCTPETIPVGVMSTMLKQISRRGRNWQTAFIPYKPLEIAQTPQQLPPMEQPTAHILARVQDFYDDLRSEDERDRSYSRSSSYSSRSSSRFSSRSSRSRGSPHKKQALHRKPVAAPTLAPLRPSPEFAGFKGSSKRGLKGDFKGDGKGSGWGYSKGWNDKGSYGGWGYEKGQDWGYEKGDSWGYDKGGWGYGKGGWPDKGGWGDKGAWAELFSWAVEKGAWGGKGGWSENGEDYGRDRGGDWGSDRGGDWGSERGGEWGGDRGGDRCGDRGDSRDNDRGGGGSRDRGRGRSDDRGDRDRGYRHDRSSGRRASEDKRGDQDVSDVDAFRKQCAARIAAGWQERVSRDGEFYPKS